MCNAAYVGDIRRIVAVMAYVRYCQVSEHLSKASSVHSVCLNRQSLIGGFVAAFGMTLVANFQVCRCFML